MKILFEVQLSRALFETTARGGTADVVADVLECRTGILRVDRTYLPVAAPSGFSVPKARSATSAYLLRGELPDPAAVEEAERISTADATVSRIFSDPPIATGIICADSPAKGDAKRVERLLGVADLHSRGFDGQGVDLVMVDSGVNTAFLARKRRTIHFDSVRSWSPATVSTVAGRHPVDHGTMCTYNATLAAPKATVLDHAVLGTKQTAASRMSALTSDAVSSYTNLLRILSASGSNRPMVVSNSWGMYSLKDDFPVGHAGNYSDNPRHPFNVVVSRLATSGADIVFAAGNCGAECPYWDCNLPSRPIAGANSHPDVLTVAGVDVDSQRVGYSSQGPGRLAQAKPDICAYTHYHGSEVFNVDAGTSTACPLVAGIIAAIRTHYPPRRLPPTQLRALIRRTARQLGKRNFDHDHGWGLIDPAALVAALP